MSKKKKKKKKNNNNIVRLLGCRGRLLLTGPHNLGAPSVSP